MEEASKFNTPQNSWASYSERTKDRPPRQLTVDALKHVQGRECALDLGPGALNESRFLLDAGFAKVIAVNSDPLETDPVALERAATFPQDRFTYTVSTFEAFTFEPKKYDFINAQYSLPFNNPSTFDRVFTDIKKSLKHGGVVTGQFFGPKDEWSSNASMTFVSHDKAKSLLEDLEIMHFKEIEGSDRLAVGGQKYWHTFHFIARKP